MYHSIQFNTINFSKCLLIPVFLHPDKNVKIITSRPFPTTPNSRCLTTLIYLYIYLSTWCKTIIPWVYVTR